MERAQRESGLARGQIQLWMGQKLAPESPLYNMAFAFSFDGAIQPEAFAEAWRQTTTAHEVIRTSIAEQNGIPARHVLPLEAVACQHLDFTTQPNPKKAFQVWAQKRARIPLPLNGPLAECFLAQLSPHQSAWYLNQHHMITDAASDVIVFQELAERYQALLSNHPSPPIQPSDYQSATANLAKSVPENARQEARAHWQSRFSQEGRTTPFYGNSNTPDSDRTRRRTLTLNHTKSTNLRDLSESDTFLSFTPQISSFAIFATILSAWLHRVGGQDDVSFDAPTRNRPTPEARTCPGLFIELLPFAVSIDPGESFRTLGEKCLSETNAFLRNAIPESSSPSADTIGNVVLNFVSASFGPFAGIPTTVDWIHSGHGDRFHALRIQIHDFDESGEYSLHFDFNEEIFPPERQEDALQHFETLLEHFLENLDAPIDAVDLLTPEERTRTLVEFNETSSEPLPKKTLVSLFKESASRFPDHVALREKDKSWSFTTLEQESAALAKALEKQGVGPGNTVVVFMKRSASAVLAILAVLRSGAAYVPVDPRYPKERVQDILENSGARVALTTTASPPLPKDTSVKSLNIEKLDATDKNPPAPHPSPDNLPLEALAYIIYTSGSTGKPKGVPITHAGLA
ncbi:MAG: condensation domain-containing protein, partial [Verrucomicrobiota bacterium]